MAEKEKKSETRYSVDDNRVIDEWHGVVVVESGDGEKLSEIAKQMNDQGKEDAEKAASGETLAQYDSPTSIVGDKVAERIPAKSHHNDSETQIRRSMLEKEPNTAPDAEPPPEPEQPPIDATIEGASGRDHGPRPQPPEPKAKDVQGRDVASKPANQPPKP